MDNVLIIYKINSIKNIVSFWQRVLDFLFVYKVFGNKKDKNTIFSMVLSLH